MPKRILAAIAAALALLLIAAPVAAEAKPRPKAKSVRVIKAKPTSTVKRVAVKAPSCASVVGTPSPTLAGGFGTTLTHVRTDVLRDQSGRTDVRRWVNYRGPEVWLSTACGGTITRWVYAYTSPKYPTYL